MNASPIRAAETTRLVLLATPALVVFVAFWLLPIAHLFVQSGGGERGFAIYWLVLSTPRYVTGLVVTMLLSAVVTALNTIPNVGDRNRALLIVAASNMNPAQAANSLTNAAPAVIAANFNPPRPTPLTLQLQNLLRG